MIIVYVVGGFILVSMIAISIHWIGSMINRKVTGMSFDKEFEVLGLPVITFENEGDKYTFLVDTGSNESVFDSRYIKKVKEKEELKESRETFVTAVGQQDVEFRNFRIPLYYRNLPYFENFKVYEFKGTMNECENLLGRKIHGILGNTFFNAYGFTVDYSNKKIYMK